jgi:hypothetical protein
MDNNRRLKDEEDGTIYVPLESRNNRPPLSPNNKVNIFHLWISNILYYIIGCLSGIMLMLVIDTLSK